MMYRKMHSADFKKRGVPRREALVAMKEAWAGMSTEAKKPYVAMCEAAKRGEGTATQQQANASMEEQPSAGQESDGEEESDEDDDGSVCE